MSAGAKVIGPDAASLALAAAALAGGELVVMPTDTVYGVAAAVRRESVLALFEAKGRPESRAIPVLVADEAALPAVTAEWPEAASALARRFWPGPLTVVVPARPEVPAEVTAGGDTVGVRAPANDAALALLRLAGGYLAVTSANRSGEPPALTAHEAAEALGAHVAYVIDGGPAALGTPSTVVEVTSGRVTIRRVGALSPPTLQAALDEAGLEIEVILSEG